MSKQDSSRQKGALRLLDIAFGEWVVRQFGSGLDAVDQAKLCNIAQAVSYAVYLKHTCLDLQAYTMLGDRVLIDLLEDIDAHDVSRIVTEDIRPLHASKDGVCVWLQKYYGFESGLFEALAKRLSSVCELDEQRRRQLKTLFSADSREQYRAAE